MKKGILLLFLIFCLTAVKYSTAQNKISWLSFEQMEALQKKEKRPVIIDVYTDWCGWCKRLDATTYADPNIVGYISRNFYAVKFNAESRDSIVFQGKTYRNRNPNAARSTHELASVLMGENQSYPTTIYLNNESQPSLVVPGYLDVNQTLPFLIYHAEQLNTNSNINDFINDFKKAFEGKRNDSAKIQWISLEEAAALQKKNPRKIFVHLKNNAFVSDRVMSASSLESADVIAALNNYYCVEIDVLTGDSIHFQNNLFINPAPGKSIHQIAYGLLQNQIGFPSVVIINEQSLVLAPIKQYLTEKHLEALLSYFEKSAYLEKTFPDYIKEMH